MPVESPPARGALWLRNRTLEASVAFVTDQHVNYPATHLLNPLRSDTWQAPAGVDTVVVLDYGGPITPVGLSLIESNLDGGTFLRFRGSDDSAQITNPVYWDLPLYAQDAVGKELRWYPGTPTFGSIGPSTNPADAPSARGRQFWGYRILPASFGSYNTVEDYYEIAVPYLITEYLALRPWEGFRPRPKNPSTRTFSKGRAKWSDPIRPYREGEVVLGGLTPAEFYDIEAMIRGQVEDYALLDVHAMSSDPSLKRGGCLYGYFSETPVDGTISSLENNTLSFQFEEASG